MKIKTQDLTGPALRYTVAVSSGRYGRWINHPSHTGRSVQDIGLWKGRLLVFCLKGEAYERWEPDVNWAHGGPIIEREQIDLMSKNRATGAEWIASKTMPWYHGPTPLVAAMRCFVASKLGDEVDVPGELL